MGSSLLVHDWSSLALGAARAYELEAVKSVNVNFFCSQRKHVLINTQEQPKQSQKLSAYPKQHLHIRVTLDVDGIQVDHTPLLQLIGMGVHVQIGSRIQTVSREYNIPRKCAKFYLLSTNHRRSQELRFASNNIERWPFLVGPSLVPPCQSKFEQLKRGSHYLLDIGFVLETSFKALRESVSNTFEDDELATSSSGSCRNTIYTPMR